MRSLDTATLDRAAKHWGAQFTQPSIFSKKHPDVAINGQEWAMQNLFNMHYKDEHDYIIAKFRRQLGQDPLEEFEALWAERVKPRSDKVFANLLAEKLAITPDGDHIEGRVGTVKVGERTVGQRLTRRDTMASANWPIYAGEEEERAAGRVRERGKKGAGVDPLPPEDTIFATETRHLGYELDLALNTNSGIAFAQAAIDAALDLLDEGTADGMLQGVSGSQPVDPNAALTGTVLFDLDLGTPAFGAATDDAPGALATAAAIADDTSANATNTLTHCRASSSNSFPTPLNAHLDGSGGLTAGTFDFEFNTDAIVSGATVSMTART